jgi:hypothetical protein
MNSSRMTATVAGVLFIIATAVNVLGAGLYNPFLAATDYLVKIAANGNQVIIGAILVVISAFASASIAIWLYPVLRKHHEALALSSVGFRVMEGMLYIVGVVCVLSLLTLSQEYATAGATNASLYQISGTVLLAVKNWAGMLGVIAFATGALMYYVVFYQSKLVPRWLSGWGLVGAALSLASALLTILGVLIPFSTVFILFNVLIAVQEMVLAVWLIVKGFNPSVIASEPHVGS